MGGDFDEVAIFRAFLLSLLLLLQADIIVVVD